MEESFEPEEPNANSPEILPATAVWPPPIEGSIYNHDVTLIRKPRRFSFTTGLMLPFVLGVAYGFMTSGPAPAPPPPLSTINPGILALIEFLALNSAAFGTAYVLRKAFQTNIREFGIGMLVSLAMIGSICLYISR